MLGSLVLGPGARAEEPSCPAGLEDARRLLEQNETASAIESLSSLLGRSKLSKPCRGEALLLLAEAQEALGYYADAAAHWRELLALPGCSPRLAREASEALAVHHEHRARDLPAARAFALRIGPAGNPAVQHRLARIERKMNNSHVSSFKFEVS
jgi:hypothetical protein